MSQRLYIGSTEDQSYDCILTESKGAEEKINKEWLCCNEKSSLIIGPWKIRIADDALWKEVEPIIAKSISEKGYRYPEDIWSFYYKDESLAHPTDAELYAWLDKIGIKYKGDKNDLQ
jgi:hypothetical protein